jgi:2-aminoadipate transaminase
LRLRQQVLQSWAAREGIEPASRGLSPEHVILTTGSQQFLELVSEVMLDPGDIVLVPAPTYFVYLGTLANLGVRAVGVKMDDEGICLDSLDSRLEELEAAGELGRVKLIYVTSYFQNPTGISLAEDRRPQLVEIARRWSRKQRIFVLEDAAYRDLCYSGPDLHSVRYFDEAGDTVIFTQTFSKSCSPGLRVGYGLLPECLREPVSSLKGNHDFGSASFNQCVISALIARGLYEKHVARLIESYRRKLGVVLAAADEFFSGFAGVEWVRPKGGLYVWMTLPEGIDTGRHGELFRRALEEGVMYVPGEYCYPPQNGVAPRNHMRLSFGVQSEEGLREGMRRLAIAVGCVVR